MQIIIDLFAIMPPPADKSSVPTVACVVDCVGICRGPVADLARLPELKRALADTVREHFHGKQTSSLSRVRAAAGLAGAASRWGDGPRATACVRLYPADAAEVRRRADAAGCKPADIVAEALRNS